MIPVKNYDVTLSSGIKATNSASIAMTPEVFDILSSKIYKDKVMAVIREIICNARDACVENNSSQPIVVHLPSYLNSTFYVRDYGKGLSKEAAMDLYLSYGVSTKTASNDLIGGMGIGSKSPFAYTNQFTVESYHNGLKHTFLVYKDKGIPCISFTGTSRTDEPSGLKVSVSVNSGDTWEFEKKFKQFGRFFDYPLVDTASNPYKFNENLNIILDNEYCTVYKKDTATYDDNYSVVMGGVSYAISIKYFDEFFKVITQNEKNSFYIVLKADIGELSVAASRETLSEDDETVARLQDKIGKLTGAFVESLTESMKDLPHHILVRKLSAFTNMLRDVFTDRIVETAKRFNLDAFDDEEYVKQLSTVKISKLKGAYNTLPVHSWDQATDNSQYFVLAGKYQKIFTNKIKRVFKPDVDIYIVTEDQKDFINQYYGSEQVFHTIEEAAQKFNIELKSPRKKGAGVKRKYQGVYNLFDSPVEEIEDDCEGFYIPTDKGHISNDLGQYEYIYKDFCNKYKEPDTLFLMVGKSSIDKIKKNTKMVEFDLKQLERFVRKIKLSKEAKRHLVLKSIYSTVGSSEKVVRSSILFNNTYKDTMLFKYFEKHDKNFANNTYIGYNETDEVNKEKYRALVRILSVLETKKLLDIILPEAYIEQVKRDEEVVMDKLSKDFEKLLKELTAQGFINLVNNIIPDYTEFVTNRKN